MPIRAEPAAISRRLVLPESVARELRDVLKQGEDGVLTLEDIQRLEQSLAERPTSDLRDSNDDKVGRVGEVEVTADGGLILSVILAGLRQRLLHKINSEERLLFSGDR